MKKKYDPDTMPSFNFYSTWTGIFRQLNAHDTLILLEWCFGYCFEQTAPSEDELEKAGYRLLTAWGSIWPQLNKQLDKWSEYCEKQNSN